MTIFSFDPEPIERLKSADPVPYPEAVRFMETRVAAIRAAQSPETLWFLEHPPLYTAGTSADPSELTDPERFPVFETGRGGRYTYHGPGQRVGYVMMDLARRGHDVRAFVTDLEAWIIRTLAEFGVMGERREGRVGIWVARGGGREDKIAAIGVRVRRWVTFHGIALNVAPDLEHFSGIVPCGIAGYGVTSLKDLGIDATFEDVDRALADSFEDVFGRNVTAGSEPMLKTAAVHAS
ncbi:MAG: lipoyl(octanoyl) transferase LipB [Rhodospirillales bacterium]